MTKFENVGRRDGPRAGGKALEDVAYFRRLASRPDLFTVPGAEAFSEPSIELIRAVITTHLDAAALGKDALKATLPLRILEYARALGDPSPQASSSISSAHRLHNTVQGPHGRLIPAPGTFASSYRQKRHHKFQW
jgi:hypothetical protein